MIYEPWAMLAVDYYDEIDRLVFPVIAQPKLNGVRAKWDHRFKLLISRQGKVWDVRKLPHLYSFLSTNYPNISLDGELYCHGMSFQDICSRVSINSVIPHKDVESIKLHVFDIIDPHLTVQERIASLQDIYPHTPTSWRLSARNQVEKTLSTCTGLGYEGIMLRQLGTPYVAGRTSYLIKVKPLQTEQAVITGFLPGAGKYFGTLGALIVTNNDGLTYAVSGGLTDSQRYIIWQNQERILGHPVTSIFPERSKKGTPLKARLSNFKLSL